MNITDILITFRESQEVQALGIADLGINKEELNVIVIEILSWLKLEHKRSLWQAEGRKIKLKPLHLNMQYPWCKTLLTLVNSKNVFSDAFKIEGSDFSFRDDTDDEYRAQSRAAAFEKYNPEKII